VANLWDALRLRPEIARTLAAHDRAVDAGSVDPRTKALCAVMVAWLNACERCVENNLDAARALGVTQEALDALERYTESDAFSPDQRVALEAAVAVTREPRGMSPVLRDRLAEYYDDGQIVELIATIGLQNYLSRASNAFRTALDLPDDPAAR
jgi:AhpD family alkylhydroperoxidase